jgi:hypothetical protein
MREFKIGQSVYYHPRNRVKAEARYVVMRLLPQANGEVRYRIRNEERPVPPVHSQCKRTAQSPWPAMSLDGLAKYGHNIAWRENRQAYGVVWHQQE